MTPTIAAPVALEAVTRRYGHGSSATTALDGVSIEFGRGTLTAVMGPSGSGKSTLLHVAAGLDRVDTGSVTLAGTRLDGLDEIALTRLRREQVSFVFQAYNLMPALTISQNVTLPLLLAGRRADRRLLAEVLERVGLAQHANKRPAELSGGQQQRVAIARAVLATPAVVFADEPTGALDTHTAATVLDLLREQLTELGQTVVMVTHDPVAASYADRVVFLVDGRIAARAARLTAAQIGAELTRHSATAAGAQVAASAR
jgi:putative ABC transport system ATP-binding protein